ncbi:hypothetical protein DFP72DRAFT_221419 [Ephemerocybe angulata]|uniref:Uncharacterized protein n=1 Tax=Ephemerocybe angulata TaxID=980116 RepID=A0A8H6I563_9AGAR|nr:hypothetical protein DFP72DRAFT_221419 [Tulosesus angulatus]
MAIRQEGSPQRRQRKFFRCWRSTLRLMGPCRMFSSFSMPSDMNGTRFKPRAQRAFERLFPNAQVTCITSRWDQVENDDGCPLTTEEAQSREEDLYTSGKTRWKPVGVLARWPAKSRETTSVVSAQAFPMKPTRLPRTLLRELFAGPGSTAAGDAAPGPQEAVRTPRTRRQASSWIPFTSSQGRSSKWWPSSIGKLWMLRTSVKPNAPKSKLQLLRSKRLKTGLRKQRRI